jgi:putative colanic acid biosynthesis acetyltransferase WcaF
MTVDTQNRKVFTQSSRYLSPWPLKNRLGRIAWVVAWNCLFRPSPKPFYAWRRLLLRLFGCQIEGRPFVSPHARITMPWNLRLADKTTLAERCELYNLALISLGPRVTIAQEAYLCAGTHDFEHPYTPLITSPITVEEDAFIAARAFVLPGVTIHRGAIVGACAVVTKDVAEREIVAGNPARRIGERRWHFTDRLDDAPQA